MTKVLVTGSRGFIGKQLIKKLKKSEVLIDCIGSKRIDLKNIEEVMKLNASDVVVHLGGKTTKGLEWDEYFNNNVLGTLNILEYCITKKIKKMIFVSSYVYGKPKYLPIDEEHPIDPHNAYTKSKYLAEQLCEFYAKNSDLNIIILRPFNIFGKTLPNGFLITNLLKSIQTNEKVTIFNKDSKRDFLHIDDFVDIVLKIKDCDFKFEVFNVGSGKSYSFNEVVKKIEKISIKKLNLQYEEDKESFIGEITADISKLNNKIKWVSKISFDEGLQKSK
jgi:nucleoside-diphosphate-sugar epimerase